MEGKWSRKNCWQVETDKCNIILCERAFNERFYELHERALLDESIHKLTIII